jgi:hypothetical protein
MFRGPIVFLLSTFLSLGPSFFNRLHAEEVNRALARIPVPHVLTHSPLKRMPVRQPVHDPSTCAICLLIHASVTVQTCAMPSLGPIALLGRVPGENSLVISPIRVAPQQCRGPPVA